MYAEPRKGSSRWLVGGDEDVCYALGVWQAKASACGKQAERLSSGRSQQCSAVQAAQSRQRWGVSLWAGSQRD